MASSVEETTTTKKVVRKVLGRDQILKARDLVTDYVRVDEWNGGEEAYVKVRGLTGSERDSFEAGMVKFKTKGKGREINLKNMRARLVVLGCVDEDGKQLFSEADIWVLGNRSAMVLGRVYDRIRELSGLSDEDEEELAGNSESDQSVDSGSTSAASLAA